LVDLWGENITNVTVRQLATMHSPIPDFDTAVPGGLPVDPLRKQLYKSPHKSWSPIELMRAPWMATLLGEETNFTTDFTYSSTNFLLLGLVLAARSGAESWEEFDQGSVLPLQLRHQFQFATTGAPGDYTRVHGYDRTAYNMPAKQTNNQDVWDVNGVFAGWSASDIVASPSAMAQLVWHIYGPNATIAKDSNLIMANPFSLVDFHFYGFATHCLSFVTGLKLPSKYGQAWGHYGSTYGYQSIVLWFPGLEFSMAIASNIETDNQVQPADTACFAYNAIAGVMLGQKSSCTYMDTGYFSGGCRCSEFSEEADFPQTKSALSEASV